MNAIRRLNEKLRRAAEQRGVALDGLELGPETLLSDALLAAGRLPADRVNALLEEATGLRSVDPTMVSFTAEFLAHAQQLLPKEFCERERVFPIKHERNLLHTVMGNPEDKALVKRLEALSGCRIAPYGCASARVLEALKSSFRAPDAAAAEPGLGPIEPWLERALDAANQLAVARAERMAWVNHAAVIKLLQHILSALVHRGASDLHFEPAAECYRVRYRKDGVMTLGWELPSVLRAPLTDRLKLMAELDLESSDRPQDGAIDYRVVRDKDIDIRVNSLPALHGEKIVLRVLDKGGARLTLTDLGLTGRDAELVERVVRQPNGLILVTGPTGSGKSTTLYALLAERNTPDVNILTAEDPVEYKIDGLTQVNCSAERGVGFHEAIRAFLRQDPDIVMVGEVRDAETADFVVKAAMTGHLALSTLHTNDAASAVSRLVNMGAPAHLVASIRPLIIAQRLVRKLCDGCKTSYEPSPAELAGLSVERAPDARYFRPAGCEACLGSGYAGRLGVYETLLVTESMERCILEQQPSAALRRLALAEGMTDLRAAALRLFEQGLTSAAEVLRVTLDV
jgi:type IV pilus assembly protein PilB